MHRIQVANQLASLSENNLLAAGLLHGHVKLNEVGDFPAATYESVLKLTDDYQEQGGYVPNDAVIEDLGADGFEVQPIVPILYSKRSSLSSLAVQLISRELLSSSLGNARLRLINPLRVVAMERGQIDIPESIQSEIPEVQQAYKVYRVLAPGHDGEGMMPYGELSDMYRITNFDMLNNPNNSINQQRRFGSLDYFQTAYEVMKRLAKHPLFEVTGGFRKEKMIGIRRQKIESTSRSN
jgi:hypothetical protein